MIAAAFADALGRGADLTQLALGQVVMRPLFQWLRRTQPEAVERMRHEPFAARGEAFVHEVGALQKAGFVAKMLASDGGWRERTRSSATATTESSEPEVLFVGDVLHPGVVDTDTLSAPLRARLARAECVVANLEGTVGDSANELAPILSWRGIRQLLAYEQDPTNDDWVSRFDVGALHHLFNHPRMVLSVANNHTLDEGVDGFGRTVDRVRRAGIEVVGDARSGDGSVVIDVGSRRVGLFAIAYGANRQAEGHLRFDQVPYRLSEPRMREVVEGLRARGATDVVALLHWGHEHEHEPSDAQRETAERLFDWGVSAVIGHHPHIVQRSESTKEHWVSYSLGDFVGGDRTIWSRFALVVSLRFSAQGLHGELIPVVQTAFWRRHRTMLLSEAPALERLVFARWFEGKLPCT